MSNELLFNHIKKIYNGGFFSEKFEIPDYLKSNLSDTLRHYQSEAIELFHHTQNSARVDNLYRHLLFNMATGSGKTMIIASIILYMFKEHGYHNFIFFVHTDAIIQKTRENILNTSSSKYLFNNPIEIDNKIISIKEVKTFPTFQDENTIYLKLTTIHKMHEDLNIYKENSITYEDLKDTPLVLLGDEAHHFNASTKNIKKNSKEYQETTWEHTIKKLLSINSKNRLYEFTATLDLSKKEIKQKYKDKIVYKYDLRQFILDGFSKEVMLLQTDQADDEKMLDAVLLSQYRKLIAIDNQIKNFKPVILFKSNQIKVSHKKQEDLSNIISALSPEKLKEHLERKNKFTSKKSIWSKVIKYYLNHNLASIVETIKEDFNQMNLLNVNKNDLIEEQPVLLNTLEEIDNPIRAVFAVAKVNEGWDVLNLYDIVRLSESAVSNKNNTDSEAQLIGRGARYFPFEYENKRSYTRRFNVVDDLGILEQLHYHTINEPSYISKLHKSIDQANLIATTDGDIGVVHEVKLKKSFTESDIYRSGKIYVNKVTEIKDENRDWRSYSLNKTFEINYLISNESKLGESCQVEENIQTHVEILELDKRYYYKAIQKNNFYCFDNLKKFFPYLASIKEFVEDRHYLKQVKIEVTLPQGQYTKNLNPRNKLKLCEEVLSKIAKNIKNNYKKYKGTKMFVGTSVSETFKNYTVYEHTGNLTHKNQKISSISSKGKPWYAYDKIVVNNLEHKFVNLIGQLYQKLNTKYKDIYLLRNDEKSIRLKLTEFDGVRGFMPDFVMIMKRNSDQTYFQVFLEPKGDHLKDNNENKWKEEMLENINKNDICILEEDTNIRLIGVKFYTSNENEFTEDLEKKIFNGEELVIKSSQQRLY